MGISQPGIHAWLEARWIRFRPFVSVRALWYVDHGVSTPGRQAAAQVPGGPHLMQRFLDDKRRRPLHAYAKGNMLWRKGVARSLSPGECEQLMGLPVWATKDLQPAKGSGTISARLRAIGNGFHLPSVMLIIAIMLAGLPVGANAAHRQGFRCPRASAGPVPVPMLRRGPARGRACLLQARGS